LRLVTEPGIRTQLKNESRRADNAHAPKSASKKTAQRAAPARAGKPGKGVAGKTADRNGKKKRK
jgi:hypothetical protein